MKSKQYQNRTPKAKHADGPTSLLTFAQTSKQKLQELTSHGGLGEQRSNISPSKSIVVGLVLSERVSGFS